MFLIDPKSEAYIKRDGVRYDLLRSNSTKTYYDPAWQERRSLERELIRSKGLSKLKLSDLEEIDRIVKNRYP